MGKIKWKERFLNEIKNYTNEQLLERCLDSAGGDDYDGGFSDRGYWMYEELQVELNKRLVEVGFLQK